MDNLLTELPDTGWRRVVGGQFDVSYLDRAALRKKSSTLPVHLQRPAVRRISTPEGRDYKLLFVPHGNARVRQIYTEIKRISHEPYVPDLLWHDHHSLLFEYVIGDFADIHSEAFATEFGRALAHIHQVRFRNISRLRNRLEFRSNLRVIARHEVLNSDYLAQAEALYRQLEPEKILRSLDYVDITRDNFVWSRNGQLKLIDAGAFQSKRAMGQFVVGSPFFRQLDSDAFWSSYSKHAETKFILENQNYLRLFHYVMKAGQKARIYSNLQDKSSKQASQHWHRLVRHRDRLISFLNRIA